MRFAQLAPVKPPEPPIALAAREYEAARALRKPSQDDLTRMLANQELVGRLVKKAQGGLTRRQEILQHTAPRLPLSKQGIRHVFAIKGIDAFEFPHHPAEEALTVHELQRWAQAEGKLFASLKYGYRVPQSILIRDHDLKRPSSNSPSPRKRGVYPRPSSPGRQYEVTLRFDPP